LLNASISQFSESDRETPKLALIREHVNKLPEALEEVRGYLRRNAPNAFEDVDSILAAHNIGTVLKEMRDIVAPKKARTRSDSVQNMAHQTLSNIRAASPPTTPLPPGTVSLPAGGGSGSVPPKEARATLLEVMDELKEPIAESNDE
jgi:hypothetical protein